MSVSYDAVIVGAGPSGAWTATCLARRGARVLLIDPSHPREKPCGGGLTGRAIALVQEDVAIRDLPRVVIDASHGNSGKDHVRQAVVAAEVAEQIATDGAAIAGVMLESNLIEGAQKLDVSARTRLAYGQSVTDACMGWDATTTALDALAEGVRQRR